MSFFGRFEDEFDDDDNVVNIKSKKKEEKKITMLIPKNMDDARLIADCLLDGFPVIIKLQEADDELSQRIIDFTAGACYCVDGSLRKVTSKILIAAPSSTNLEGVFED